MTLNNAFPKCKTVCINLKHRKEKKIFMERQARKKNFKFDLYKTKLHKNPKRGCLESHISVIQNAKNNGYQSVLILEDDCLFIKDPNNIPTLPHDWDMIYLGGNVKYVLDKYNDNWSRIVSYTTHCYCVNLTNTNLVNTILAAKDATDEIDAYYIKNIHTQFKCYMLNPMIAIQKEGYSDIENAKVNYNFMQQTLNGFAKPEHIIKDKQYIMKLPDIPDEQLPYVSIVTPTYKRRQFFSLPIFCFKNFIYPKNKIEWIIAEEIHQNEDQSSSVEDMVQFDNRIKYFKSIIPINDKPLPIGAKRNLTVEHASHDIIIHMDDDDYYPPESILARVKLLVKYKEHIGMIGSSTIGAYNMIEQKSKMLSDGTLSIGEASMAYYKSFWEQQKFTNTHTKGEYRGIIDGRFNQILDVPYYFILHALNHNQNMTLSKRPGRTIDENTNTNTNGETIFDTTMYWNEDTKEFIEILARNIIDQ